MNNMIVLLALILFGSSVGLAQGNLHVLLAAARNAKP